MAISTPTSEPKQPVQHLWPVSRWVAPWPPGSEFFWETKRGVLSYVITRPLLTAVGVVAGIAGVYGDGEFRHDRAYPYIAFFGSLSQTWALYCLIIMYQGTKDELKPPPSALQIYRNQSGCLGEAQCMHVEGAKGGC